MRKTESTTIIIDVKAESIYKPGIKKDEMKRIRLQLLREKKQQKRETNKEMTRKRASETYFSSLLAAS